MALLPSWEVPGRPSQVGKHVGIQVVGEGYSGGIQGVFQGYSAPKKGIQDYGSHGAEKNLWVFETTEARQCLRVALL